MAAPQIKPTPLPEDMTPLPPGVEVLRVELPSDMTPLPPGIEVLRVDDSPVAGEVQKSLSSIRSTVDLLRDETARTEPLSGRVMSPEEFEDLSAAGQIKAMSPQEAKRDRVRSAVARKETLEDVQGIIDTESRTIRDLVAAAAMSNVSGRPLDVESIPPPLSEDPVRPGLLQRAIDYGTRPISTVAGGLKAAIEGGDVVQEALAGLKGTKKTFMSDVLEAAGVPELGKVGFQIQDRVAQAAGTFKEPAKYELTGRDVLGFVGDVFADPLTYVTAGTSRALRLGNGLKLSTKGEKLLETEIARYAGAGLERDAARKAAEEAIKGAVDAGRADLVARGGVRWAGVTIPGSPQVGEAFRKTVRGAAMKVRSTPAGKRLAEIGERTAALVSRDYLVRDFPQYVDDKQTFFNLMKADKLDILDEATVLFKGTDHADRIAITHAIELGQQGIDALPDKLRDIAHAVVNSQTAMRREEIARGLGEGFLDDYMMHAYTNYPAIKQARGQFGGVSTSLAANKERVIPTLSEAREMGLDPVSEDAMELLVMRKLASARAMRSRDLLEAAVAKHGVAKPGEMTSKDWFRHRIENELVPAPQFPRDPTAAALPEMPAELARHASPAGEVFIPRRIAEDIASMGSRPSNRLLQGYDAVNNWWKGTVTSVFPAFHARNAVSNVALSALDLGVTALNPIRRAEAIAVMRGQKGLLYSKFGERYSFDELRREFRRQGLEGGFAGRIALEERSGRIVGRDNPLFRGGRKVGETIESEAKMTHFLNSIRRGMTPKEAAARTKLFLFDYDHLSNFERDVIRRAIPFWTFYKNNAPLQLRALATEPGRQAVLLKAFATPGDPATIEREMRMWPDYVSEGLAMKVGEDRDGNPLILWGLGLPIEDLNRVLPQTRSSESLGREVARKNFVSMMAPLAKLAVEEMTGWDTFSDRPLEDMTRVYDAWGRQIERLPGAIQRFVGFKKNLDRKGNVVYEMNPHALHLVRTFILSRVYSTAGKAFDERKDPTTRLLNTLTGARLGTIDAETQIYPALRRRAEERLQAIGKEKVQQERQLLFEGPKQPPEEEPAMPPPPPAPVQQAQPKPAPPPKVPKPKEPVDVSRDLQRGKITTGDLAELARAGQRQNYTRQLRAG